MEDLVRPLVVKDSGQQDLFRSRLDQIINLKHPLVQLSLLLYWDGLHESLSVYYSDSGRPGLSRLIENQQVEGHMLCHLLNKMTTLGMPQTVKTA